MYEIMTSTKNGIAVKQAKKFPPSYIYLGKGYVIIRTLAEILWLT